MSDDKKLPTLKQPASLMFHWSFDAGGAGPAQDLASKRSDVIGGVHTFVRGPGKGLALRFDGFTTFLERASGPALTSGSFSVEAWIAPGAFPWCLAPIVDMAPKQGEGFHLSLDAYGHIVFSVALDGEVVVVRSPEPLKLTTWHHVAGVYEAGRGLTLWVGGTQVTEQLHGGMFRPAVDGSAVLGRSRIELAATGGIRIASHLPITNYLDALVDDVKVHQGILSKSEIASTLAAVGAPQPPPLPVRKLPSGAPGKGKFGAFYTRLSYYDAWDRRWRVGDHPDVVVRFDDEAYRLVFWRGTNYIPCWASEEGIWYTNEFNETWGHGATGCAEPMSDKHCAYSHVRVIESSDARVVIHWRYALVDVLGVRPRKDPVSKWSDWSDEVYTIYPDGTGTRKITLHSTQPLDPHEFQETIVVLSPGQRPDDVLDAEALTMANMAGEEHTYSWAGGPPQVIDKPDRCNVQVVNTKSATKPFLIVSDGHCLKRDLSKSDRPVFPVYKNEIRPPQLFPWWNHWPTAELPSDGRFAEAPDRAAHSSLLTGMEWEDYEVTPTSRTRVHLHGMSRKRARDLVPLAKSWLHPAPLQVSSQGVRAEGYDILERAYVLSSESGVTAISATVEASRGNPVVNLAIIVRNWQGDTHPALAINGVSVARGVDYRIGHRTLLESEDLLVWIRLSAEQPLQLDIGVVSTASEPAAKPITKAKA
ncbi:MAG: LamG domain-containing protein [Rhizobium sp.]|nr:LamG domain-containing protein [Rhizobium sp.]